MTSMTNMAAFEGTALGFSSVMSHQSSSSHDADGPEGFTAKNNAYADFMLDFSANLDRMNLLKRLALRPTHLPGKIGRRFEIRMLNSIDAPALKARFPEPELT